MTTTKIKKVRQNKMKVLNFTYNIFHVIMKVAAKIMKIVNVIRKANHAGSNAVVLIFVLQLLEGANVG